MILFFLEDFMLKAKEFFTKKTITLLVSGIVIIALLIIAVATGGARYWGYAFRGRGYSR